MTNVIELVKDRFENAQIFDNDDNDAIIPVNYMLDPASKIMFVVGTNASGKSVVGKIVEYVSKDANLAKRSCSMRNRTSGMLGQMMIFGSEEDSSTGQNSVKAAVNGINTTVSEQNSVLILDEPDLGLADEYSAAMGQLIAQKVNEHYDNIGLFVVITHSRRLLEAALAELTTPYSSVYVGDASVSFDDWMKQPFVPATVEDLINLRQKGIDTWRRIENMQAPSEEG